MLLDAIRLFHLCRLLSRLRLILYSRGGLDTVVFWRSEAAATIKHSSASFPLYLAYQIQTAEVQTMP